MNVRRAARAIAAAVCSVGLLASCSSGGPERNDEKIFSYFVPGEVATTNSASYIGYLTDSSLISPRLFPGVFVHGPAGQMIPNRDVATAQLLPGTKRQVVYSIAETANFSDGVPLTCDDFTLAVQAGKYPEVFDSHVPLMQQIEEVKCQPGAKEFTVVFHEGQGQRWRHLFRSGTVMPAHVLSNKLGIAPEDLLARVQSGDVAQMQDIGDAWAQDFRIDRFDPAVQVSFGPYRIERVTEGGGLVLVANEAYNGDAPAISPLVIRPHSSTAGEFHETGGVVGIADVPRVADAAWTEKKTGYAVEPTSGKLIDQLVLAKTGMFTTPEDRQAFAACIDQEAVAQKSTDVSGVPVTALGTRLSSAESPTAIATQDIGAAHIAVDLPLAERLRGQTIRIAYVGPNERFAAMVEAIRQSCEPAGINIVDTSAEFDVKAATIEPPAIGDAGAAYPTDAGYIQEEGVIAPLTTFAADNYATASGSVVPPVADALLISAEPAFEYGHVSASTEDQEELRKAEEMLWQEVPTVPLASQPRVFIMDTAVDNVAIGTTRSGIGWNMDRWSKGAK
ncbi:MAG: ABC transporter substrate-binding protein [Corynebacterium glucuronolyticum]|nr:ABC transporter substrate-binding protein [Corynebacterium glucuronolyticum]